MNGFSFPNENNINYDKNEDELNNKIKEYKEIYNKSSMPYFNDNNNISQVMANLNKFFINLN